MEIFYFLLVKMIAVFYFLFVLAIVLVPVLLILDELSAKWSRTIFAVICAVPLIVYVHAFLVPTFSEGNPSRFFYELLTFPYDKFKARNDKVAPTRINVAESIERFELIDWNPPKHFYVTFKNVKTGAVHEHTYVSKYCNSHNELKRGEQFNIVVKTYAMSNDPAKIITEFQNLYGVFCK